MHAVAHGVMAASLALYQLGQFKRRARPHRRPLPQAERVIGCLGYVRQDRKWQRQIAGELRQGSVFGEDRSTLPPADWFGSPGLSSLVCENSRLFGLLDSNIDGLGDHHSVFPYPAEFCQQMVELVRGGRTRQ
jgi:hypothetical protein